MRKNQKKSNKPRFITIRIKYYPLHKNVFILPFLLFFFIFFISVGNYISHNWVTVYATNDSKTFEKFLVTIPDGENFVVDTSEISDQVIFNGSRDRKEVALTFDADMTLGMENQIRSGEVKSYYNKKVIDILNQTKTKATLFLTGMWIEMYPDDARELARNHLFELGNHSYSHPGFDGDCYGLRHISDDEDDAEIQKTQQLLQSLSGFDNVLFRFPGGCYSKIDVNDVYANGLQAIQWDVAGDDGFNFDTASIERNVLDRVQNGSIIVLHMHGGPNAPMTAEALPKIISTLQE